MSFSISGFDEARNDLMQELRNFQTDQYVTIGVHEDDSARVDGDTSISNAQLLAAHEFGTETIPARPTLIPGVESGNDEYASVIEDVVRNGGTLEEALQRAGAVAVGLVQQYMTDLKSPALDKPRKDGSTNPLIDTGSLRGSIDMQVTPNAPTEGL